MAYTIHIQKGSFCEQWGDSGSMQKDSGVRQGSRREMIELKEEKVGKLKEESGVTTEEGKKTWSWKGDLY